MNKDWEIRVTWYSNLIWRISRFIKLPTRCQHCKKWMFQKHIAVLHFCSNKCLTKWLKKRHEANIRKK
jgi:hypothetical protein